MIQLQLGQALILYSAILGVVVAVIWLYTELTVRRAHRFLEKQSLWRCVFCGYTYLDEGALEVSQCPRCESFNSTEDAHARFVPSRRYAANGTGEPDAVEMEQASRRNPSKRKRPKAKRRGPRRR